MSLSRRLATGGVAFATTCGGLFALAASAHAAVESRVLFGLATGNALVRFTSDSPGTPSAPVAITGLQAGESVLGIDFRPLDGALFGVGSTSRIYTINPTTGAATQVGALPLTPPLSGTAFGVDFNPVPDRIRIVSDADQNLRANPATGLIAAVDTTLAYDAADVAAGMNPNVVGAAYTNNVAGAVTTTLYGIDFGLNTLVRQGSVGGTPISPNSGALFTIGPLGLDVTSAVGFDIADGSGTAYAALATPGQPSALYTIDLTTGAATPVGGLAGLSLRGLAVAPAGSFKLSSAAYAVSESAGTATITVNRTGGTFGAASVNYATGAGSATAGTDYTDVSGTLNFAEGEMSKTFTVPILNDNLVEGSEIFFAAISSTMGAALGSPTLAVVTIIDNEGLIYAVTAANNLISFSPSDPTTLLSGPTPITGLGATENIHGIDFRPATGQLYALGSASRIYTINPTTGVATQVGSDGAFTLSGAFFGVDFNPVPDRIRVTSDTEQNLRLNPNDGTLTLADAGLNYAAGDINFGGNPNVVASAYTNSFAGATTTTLYDIDAAFDSLVTQVPPNDGKLNTVGPLGVDVNHAAFDISPAGNIGFAALTLVGGTTSGLYTIDLASGAAANVGPIGVASTITGFALAPAGTLAVNPAGITVNEPDGTATVTVTRAGTAGAVTVDYTTVNGSALAGTDYTTTSGTLTFVDGDGSESFTIPIINDPTMEAAETLIVNLSNATGGAVISPTAGSGVVAIVDDDAIFYALDSEGKVLTFTGGTLGVPTEVPITGLQASETLSGIDVRPADNLLYALGSTGRLYTLNPATGIATMVGSGPISPILPAGTAPAFGFDFNPVVDRLRIISDAEQNLRVHPDTVTVVDGDAATAGVQPDGALAYAAADSSFGTVPDVVAAAYTNSIPGLATTTLYDIDAVTDKLVIQNPPNEGKLVSVGALGVDAGPLTGMDIAAAGGTAFASITTPVGTSSGLYTISLATGAAALVGTIGGGATIRDLAVARPATTFLVVPSTTTPVSGTPITVTVTAKLPGGATDTSYVGTPSLTSSDLVFVPGTCSAAVAGVSTCTGTTLGDLGIRRLSAVDTAYGIGSSTNVTVQPTGLMFDLAPIKGSVNKTLIYVVKPTVGLAGASVVGYTATRTLVTTGGSTPASGTVLSCLSAVCAFGVKFAIAGDKTVQVTDNSTPARATPEIDVLITTPTLLFLESSATTVTATQTVELAGFLISADDGSDVAFAPVKIYGRRRNATTFQLLRTLTTDDFGEFFTTIRINENMVFKAVFAGGDIFEPSTSNLVTVLARVKVVVTSPPSGTAIPAGSNIFVSAATFPVKPGVRANLIWVRPDGVRQSVASAITGADGRVRIGRGPLPRGTYKLYVLVPASGNNISGASPLFTIRIV